MLQIKTGKKQTMKKSLVKDNVEFFIMALPAVILLILFYYMPLYGLIIGFKKFNPHLGIMGSPWVGFENFKFFFTSSDALIVTRNTLIYNSDFIIFDMISAVVLALLFFNLSSRKALKAYNTILILPKFLSMVLIAFIVYAILNPVSGVLNQFISLFGLEAIDWYSKVNIIFIAAAK